MKRAIALLLATSIALAPMSASASTPADMAAARKKFEHALELEKAGDFKGALAVLREVAAVKSTAEVRFHLGICLERLGRLVEARVEYVAAKSDAELKEGTEAAVLTQKANDRVTDLDARIPKIAITVPEDVISAKVSVDNAPPVSLLVTPVISVDPGTHKLVVTAPGRRAFSRTVLVKERDPVFNMSAELPPEEIEEPAAPAPKPIAPAPRPRDVEPKSSPYPYVFGGVGLVALGAAGIMYAMRNSTIREMDDACGPARDQCPRSIESTESRGRTYTTAGNILLGVGAAALATGVIIYLAEPKKGTRVSVGGGPATLGVTFATTF
jgi:hypothetical protein